MCIAVIIVSRCYFLFLDMFYFSGLSNWIFFWVTNDQSLLDSDMCFCCTYNSRCSWCNTFLSVHVNSSYFSPFLIKVYYWWYPIVLFACRIVDDILFLLTRRSCICWKRCFDFVFLFFTLVRWRMGIFVFYLWFQCNLLLITPVFNWCASSGCSFGSSEGISV